MFAQTDLRKIFVNKGNVVIILDRRYTEKHMEIKNPPDYFVSEDERVAEFELGEAECELLYEQLAWLLGR